MITIILSLACMISSPDFRSEQLKHYRVSEAYKEKQELLQTLLKSKNLSFGNFEMYLQAYKKEGILEVWTKAKHEKKYTLLISYPVCKASGMLGPKRKEGDLQVPEGFYHINHFNPQSNYHLSLGINYPNASDKVFADKQHPGGSIYIHGSCVTIGCLPLTDDKIKELYILAVEAKSNGQSKIPVTIYPMKMTDENLKNISAQYNRETLALWQELKTGYQLFEKTHVPPKVVFLPDGRHTIR